MTQIITEDTHPSTLGSEVSGDHSEQSALPSSTRTDECDPISTRYTEVYAIKDGLFISIGIGDVLQVYFCASPFSIYFLFFFSFWRSESIIGLPVELDMRKFPEHISQLMEEIIECLFSECKNSDNNRQRQDAPIA